MKTATLPKPEKIFRAVSDTTRLRILNLLFVRELCVCDIVSVLRVPQSRASRHLAYLRKVGLVEARKDGVWCYYRLSPATTSFGASVWECLEQCGAMLPRLQADVLRLKQGHSECCQ